MARRRDGASEGPGLFGPMDPEPSSRPAGRAPTKRAARREQGQTVPVLDTTGFLACQVALRRPMRREYTYLVPPDNADSVIPGVRVAVPFAGKREVGVVVSLDETPEVAREKLKPVHSVMDVRPLIDEELLDLTRWMAREYACSWGEALAAVLPAPLKRERQRRKVVVVRIAEGVGEAQLAELETTQPKQHRVLRTLLDVQGPMERTELLRKLNVSGSPVETLARNGLVVIEKIDAQVDELVGADTPRVRPERLSQEQEAAVEMLVRALDVPPEDPAPKPHLLYGVTGSGKTEVYLRAIEEALARGRGAIVVVPEIALTPQTVGWFRSRFGRVAVLHSRMSDVQRLDEWLRAKSGEARVVVGARSALFAPVPDLGVVVVDEEHEPSFKQGSVPRYHARAVAVERARLAGAVCVLGSATPSLESWCRAEQGEYERIVLRSRVAGGELPEVEVVDLRAERQMAEGLFSRRLEDLLTETLTRKEQVILFLNRRGFSPVLWCRACNETVRCRQCDQALTFHRRIQRVVCHSCCEELQPPAACPSCTAPALRFLGVGSERLEEALARRWPDARIARMDSDTMLRREDYEETLAAFGRGEIDVLTGTQMIAKGLDFPRVTLVGVVAADSGLHLPDFRASERTYQLLSQVSGRAGRGALAGRILVQTSVPDHAAITTAARHDYETFVKGELELRADLDYPPYGRLIRAVFEHEDEVRTSSTARAVAESLREALEGHIDAGRVYVLGPGVAPISQLRGRYRWHLLVRVPGAFRPEYAEGFTAAREHLAGAAGSSGGVRVVVDIDPVGMM